MSGDDPDRPDDTDTDTDAGDGRVWGAPADDPGGTDTDDVPTGRRSPVGEPVVRGDRSITGRHATEAVRFDPDSATDRERAAETVRAFATDDPDGGVTMLRGAAAAAALVRGEGSYRGAAARAEVSVSFVRTWARVHDLPESVRREVAAGRLAPSAAKHVARLEGVARLTVAFAAVDAGLGVREVRSAVGDVADGTPVETALRAVDATPGEVTVELPTATYRALRRRAVLEERPLDAVVADALVVDAPGAGDDSADPR